MTPARVMLWIACVVALVIPGVATAQEATGASPEQLDFGEVGPGSVALQPLTITNADDATTAFDIAASGDVAGWLSVHRDNAAALSDTGEVVTVTVEPGQSMTVTARIEVPSSATAGGVSGALQVIERAEGGGPGRSFDVGVAVAVAAERIVAGEIVTLEAPDVSVGSRIELRAVVRNTGNVVFDPAAEIVVFDGDDEVARSVVRGGLVTPGNEQDVFFALESVLPQGVYRVETTFSAADEELGSANAEVSVLSLEATGGAVDDTSSDGGTSNRRTIALIAAGVVLVAILGAVAWNRRSGPTALHAETDRPRPGRAAPGRHHAKDGDVAWEPDPNHLPHTGPKRAAR